ncbi:hypothetical protein [Oceanobacillus jeddahense]|uniref:Uncharacterized protein n=1 Tax=Oceanobacillus jeddahense TaxID=1462527 RepID=A0ABY5JUQ3_9BACI|nr:hypothetical protein [Oceanobacillus jeddahense]UUI04082.1 hypothetical protein NP439_05180 [Oceanobacillus jeddahense]
MNILANNQDIGASKFGLWSIKFFDLLTFKKSKHLKKVIQDVEKQIEDNKNKKIY